MTPSSSHDGNNPEDDRDQPMGPVRGTPAEDRSASDSDDPEHGRGSVDEAPSRAAGDHDDGGVGEGADHDEAARGVAGDPRGPRDVAERLDPRVVVYWLVSGLVGWGVLASIGTVVFLAFRAELLGDQRWITMIVAALLGLLLVWSLVSPSMAYRRWRFAIGEQLMQMRYGIVFHEEKSIPISRLQHVDLTRGPIERAFGLATLVVFTAGTEAASFRLPGLAVARAEDLRDRILIARGDDVI